MNVIPFQHLEWDNIPETEYPGLTGSAYWKTIEFSGLRLRQVKYSPRYSADHWCSKGHFVHCLSGSFLTEFETGEKQELQAGTSYVVSNDETPHRSFSETGALLLIIDGDFLQPESYD
jgi:hypothetical protein